MEEVLVAEDFGHVINNLLTTGHLYNRFLCRLIPGTLLIMLAQQWGC
jgi:hypothetical protein